MLRVQLDSTDGMWYQYQVYIAVLKDVISYK